MVTYTQNELVSATEISKQFGKYISIVKDGIVEKIGVLKNNKLNAVILSVDEYEKMSLAMDLLKNMKIYEEIKDRLNTPNNRLLNGEDVLKKYGLSLDV
jgi:PHD/YefM family antitoxin component YafN of YafNO toxin-antitoxin module